MESNREELRTELLAMLHAAPELPVEDRESLADVFLDNLHKGYQVTPRSVATPRPAAPFRPAPRPFAAFSGMAASLGVFLLLTAVLFTTVFPATMGHWHRPSILPLLLILFVVMRFARGGPGRWHRRHARW